MRLLEKNYLKPFVLGIALAFFFILAETGLSDPGFGYSIRDDATGGDCILIGNWDLLNKTCTLTTDLAFSGTHGIEIADLGLTLNGNGHTLTGTQNCPPAGPCSPALKGVLAMYRTKVFGDNVTRPIPPTTTIENLVVKGFDVGIDIGNGVCSSDLQDNPDDYITNMTVKGNTTSSNVWGIKVNCAVGNTLSGNTASNNRHEGITLFASPKNTVKDNTSSFNNGAATYDGTGIHLTTFSGDDMENSFGNTVSGNTVSWNYNGIQVDDFSGNNTIVGNTVTSNNGANGGEGIFLASDNNYLSGNAVSSNKWGILLVGSSANLLTGNTISYNSSVGLGVQDQYLNGENPGNNNKIYRNNFLNNYRQVWVSVLNNNNLFSLPDPQGGNYWSDYDAPEEGCSDLNDDRFCDAPNAKVSGVTDNLPWTISDAWVDNVPPNVTNVQPSGIIGNASPTINVDYTDERSGIYVGSVNVTLDGKSLGGCSATPSHVSCPISDLAVGTHTIGGSVKDRAGNESPILGSFTLSALWPGLTSRLSTSSSGAQANGSSYHYMPVISADNHYTVFASAATNLVGGDTNNFADVFKKDNFSGKITRISTKGNGAQSSGGNSTKPSISEDGTFVAFSSSAIDLLGILGDKNGVSDVFKKDTTSGKITRVSTNSAGKEANLPSSWPSISADGRYVAFVSTATNLVSGDTNAANDIFVKDTSTGQPTSGRTVRVSTALGGGETNINSASTDPAISPDGKYVVFRSNATNLVPGMKANTNWQIYAKEIVDAGGNLTSSGAISCLSCPDGSPGNGDSGWPAISGADDGGDYWVTYPSYASNLVSDDTNEYRDIFRANVGSGQITRVSTDSAGNQAYGYSAVSQISKEGRYVTFYSEAPGLVAGDTNQFSDIFVKDTSTGQPTSGQTVRVSTATGGGQADLASDYPFIVTGVLSGFNPNPAPFYVAFVSNATNLVAGDTNGTWDVFLSSKE